MIDTCPYCDQELNLSDAQIAKVKAALAKLPAGNLLKLGCPHCQKPFELQADGTLPGTKPAPKVASGAPLAPKQDGTKINPPPPPDISWLSSGKEESKEVVEDTPMFLVLMERGPGLTAIMDALDDEGFLPVLADSIDDAIDRMQFANYTGVILHTRFEGSSIDNNNLHNFIKKMNMFRRRNIHYTLIGPEFKTLYDLEALSNSANLVVNDNDVPHFKLILRKSLYDNQKLYGPLADALIKEGKITASIWIDLRGKAEQKVKSAVLKDLLEVNV
ncbi:MAG: hypothetical protein IME97_10220 [Proteobacteria bacterium]|nr:hypothetical protein [Pseudomonadota bacterium]